jgi:ketosteroid isomerase-like protein
MKAIFWTAVAMAAFVGPAMAQGAGGPNSDTRAADKTEIERLDRLVSTTSSPEEGLSVFAPDTVIQDDFFPTQRHGVAEIRQDFKAYMDAYTSFHADIVDMSVDADGQLGVAISHQHFTAKGHNGTPDLDAMIRQTDVFHKIDGKWRITYEHLSVPIDLKTGQAVWK